MRRFRSQRKEKRGNISTKTGGRRLSRSGGGGRRRNPQGQSLGNERPTREIQGNQGMDENKDAQRPQYGYLENRQRGRKNAGRDAGYEADVESGARREGATEDEDQGLDQSTDLSQRPARSAGESEEGRPDQLSSEEEDEDLPAGDDENITERLDIDRERSTRNRDRRNLDPNSMNTDVEPLEVEEGDSEARGGTVEADPEDEEFRKRGRGRGHGNRTNEPE